MLGLRYERFVFFVGGNYFEYLRWRLGRGSPAEAQLAPTAGSPHQLRSVLRDLLVGTSYRLRPVAAEVNREFSLTLSAQLG